MARSTSSRQGASAKAGKPSSTRKTVGRRAPAAAARSPKPRAATPKTAPRKAQPARKAAATKRGGIPALPIVLVVTALLLGWFLYPTARLHYQEQRQLTKLEQQLVQVRQRNQQLKRDVQRLQTPEGIESAARDLGLAKKGEQVWVAVPSGGKAPATRTASPVRAAQTVPGPWTRVLDFLFGVGQ